MAGCTCLRSACWRRTSPRRTIPPCWRALSTAASAGSSWCWPSASPSPMCHSRSASCRRRSDSPRRQFLHPRRSRSQPGPRSHRALQPPSPLYLLRPRLRRRGRRSWRHWHRSASSCSSPSPGRRGSGSRRRATSWLTRCLTAIWPRWWTARSTRWCASCAVRSMPRPRRRRSRGWSRRRSARGTSPITSSERWPGAMAISAPSRRTSARPGARHRSLFPHRKSVSGGHHQQILVAATKQLPARFAVAAVMAAEASDRQHHVTRGGPLP